MFFVSAWLGGSLAVIGGLASSLIPGGWISVGLAFALLLTAAVAFLRAMGGAYYPGATTRRFVFRPLWYAMLFGPVVALCGGAGLIIGLVFGTATTAGLVAVCAAAGLLFVAAIFGYADSRRLTTRHLEIALAGLPAAFDGLRAVQISDLHVGPHTSPRFLGRVVDAVREANADIIFVTGDQVDDYVRDVSILAAAFGTVSAPLGTFVVAGNHDVYAGWNGVRRGLSAMGMTVLVNESVPVERDGERIWIAGTGDPAGLGWSRDGGNQVAPDVKKTMAGRDESDCTIVLAHNPVLWPALVDEGADLVLSGHTHYGQFAIPRLNWNLAGVFIDPSMGMRREGDSVLYVNPGTNYWGIPFRLGTPPEVTVITLSRAGS